ncbi:hypothetical protein GCM10009730_67980 [Streptomyces albidochromogenes]
MPERCGDPRDATDRSPRSPHPMTRLIWSLAVWWLLIAMTLWVVGKIADQPASLPACAVSAALLVAVGEAGDWLRRRRSAY